MVHTRCTTCKTDSVKGSMCMVHYTVHCMVHYIVHDIVHYIGGAWSYFFCRIALTCNRRW